MYMRVLSAACGLAFTGAVCADAIYMNDFDSGVLRSNERTFSAWFDDTPAGSEQWKDNNSRWGLHNESSAITTGLSGYKVGHHGSTVHRRNERSFYELTVDFTGWDTGDMTKSLKFKFDSWIQDDFDDDGFNVIAYNGNQVDTGIPAIGNNDPDDNEMVGNLPGGWALLDPILDTSGWDPMLAFGLSGSDMDWDEAEISNTQLDEVSGAREPVFTGYDTSQMTGTALFDVSGFTGLTTIRFSFGSGASSSSDGEGINIDHVMIAGLCEDTVGGDPNGSGATCDPEPDIPEPTTLALAALGLVALRRKTFKFLT